MALSARLDLRQSQNLVMTPQLQQAIKLLQFNNLELNEFVEAEIEQNPLLERDDGDGPATLEALEADNIAAYDKAVEGEGAPSDAAADSGWEEAPDGPDTMDRTSAESLPAGNDDPGDADYDNNWSSASVEEADPSLSPTLGSWENAGSGGGRGGEDLPGLEESVGQDKTLREHLLEQITLDIVQPDERIIAADLLDSLDDAGYYTGDLEDVAEQLACPLETVEAVLGKMQSLDPPGIFARNLSECLALQLKDRNRLDPAIQALLDNLPLLAKRDMQGLLKICGVDVEDMTEMVEEIRSLNPKPGLAFERDTSEAVIPDVLVRPAPDGTWIVELNPDTLPRVLVNNAYLSQVSRAPKQKSDREYLSECHQSANWLVRSLHQRATTILKVAGEIVRQQDGFFQHGIQYLRPLVLRDIATVIEMHESTVSRVTSNKFMATPRGIYELKYFFTSAIASSAGGDALSAEAVRFKIKKLIDEEPPTKVLSDDRIVEILKGQGVDIARRTIAKYREAMKIPSSVQRRREKSMRI
ncbi:RNA polymerase factor sigma-54 [Nisaea sp.]|uniref:RNA polymerase factor sigma-54 n=1 Tax=Nisaea sp. TaxID=2024842 RepID=UPI002B27C217|nr:RNA polymerase factor sigma-54 [Nisaea sp.]